jgi:8-oxo-dGTP diphosphatase
MPFSYKYPRPAVTVDMLVFKKAKEGLQLLLIQRDRDPFQGFWAIPGGFMDMDETLEAAARRELYEETGLQNIALKQMKAYSAIDRDPRHRTISVAFTGFVSDNQQVKAGDDARKAQWFPVRSLPSLAFDHTRIIADAVAKINA